MPVTIDDPANLASLYFEKPIDKTQQSSSSSSSASASASSSALLEPYVSDAIEIATIDEARGRGLVAKEDIPAGTCLFVTPPAMTVDVNDVFGQWSQSKPNDAATLEAVAEQCLVDTMKATFDEAKRTAPPSSSLALANSFLALVGGASRSDYDTPIPSLERLLGEDARTPISIEDVDEETLRMIVRRNAFGPDFVTYAAMTRHYHQLNGRRPHRMLGLYPLADMGNHSCHPNTVRVYVGEVMVVHASADIPQGEEVFSSYVPPISPYPHRQAALLQTHGFVCQCSRCQVEAPLWNKPPPKLLQLVEMQQQPANTLLTSEESLQRVLQAIVTLEDDLLPKTKPNELQRYLRLGFTQLYMRYLNQALASRQTNQESVLRLCMQLHFGFVAGNPSSTEHLSILHLCYELVGKQHAAAADKSKTLPSFRFWTEQVKQACLTRYGNLGQDLEIVRRVMTHSRLVLRTPHGMPNAEYPFI